MQDQELSPEAQANLVSEVDDSLDFQSTQPPSGHYVVTNEGARFLVRARQAGRLDADGQPLPVYPDIECYCDSEDKALEILRALDLARDAATQLKSNAVVKLVEMADLSKYAREARVKAAEGSITITLTEYEQANLISLWEGLGCKTGLPYLGVDTGDWYRMFWNKLVEHRTEWKPNCSAEDMSAKIIAAARSVRAD